jgi:hypothetical protein
MPEFRNWPDDFPVVEPSTDFDIALVAFFGQKKGSGNKGVRTLLRGWKRW